MNEYLYKLLPNELSGIIKTRLNIDKLYELRLRNYSPVLVNYGGEFYFLTKEGISAYADNALCPDGSAAQGVVMRASEYSIYAHNENLCQGFLTVRGGIRVGVAGEAVKNGADIRTVKNFCSVNIRVPHEVYGCASNALCQICQNGINNTLIISSPGAGKTTYLRDIARSLSNKRINVLLADERMELASCLDGRPMLDIGKCTDVMSGFTKEYAFFQGIRSMRPDVIITDELMGETDYRAIEHAAMCGVKVIASVHADSLEQARQKPGFERLMNGRLFDRYVVLKLDPRPGTLEGIYDGEFSKCA